jgi:hypothetical protein
MPPVPIIFVGILCVIGGVAVLIWRHAITEVLLRLNDAFLPHPNRRRRSQQVPAIFAGVLMLIVGVALAFR